MIRRNATAAVIGAGDYIGAAIVRRLFTFDLPLIRGRTVVRIGADSHP